LYGNRIIAPIEEDYFIFSNTNSNFNHRHIDDYYDQDVHVNDDDTNLVQVVSDDDDEIPQLIDMSLCESDGADDVGGDGINGDIADNDVSGKVLPEKRKRIEIPNEESDFWTKLKSVDDFILQLVLLVMTWMLVEMLVVKDVIEAFSFPSISTMRKLINSNNIKDLKFGIKDLENYVSVYGDHIGNIKGKATVGGPIGARIIRVERPLTGMQSAHADIFYRATVNSLPFKVPFSLVPYLISFITSVQVCPVKLINN
jgi:hypothetical protein